MPYMTKIIETGVFSIEAELNHGHYDSLGLLIIGILSRSPKTYSNYQGPYITPKPPLRDVMALFTCGGRCLPRREVRLKPEPPPPPPKKKKKKPRI